MEVTGGIEEGFVREWAPCTHMLNLIPPRVQMGLFSYELNLTCIDAVSEYIALGTNVGLVYWYDRKKGNIQRLRCETGTSPITYVKIVNTVDYMVGAGNAAGQVTVFQIPKEHPENIPDIFKPKVEPKVERYTIGDLHKTKITAIEWSKNGMRLFSGDKNGVIIMTEIDFYMHLCKSMEIVNEEHEIVQISYSHGRLLVSSLYRCIVCERKDNRWLVNQLGKKERKSLCRLGAVFVHSYAAGGAPAAYCARAGQRLWRADVEGVVHQTILFKDAITNPLSVVELLNPAPMPAAAGGELGPLQMYRGRFLVAHDASRLHVLDPTTAAAAATLDRARKILSVSVNNDEIFILEGPRSVVRLSHSPEPGSLHAEPPVNMTKSLTSSIQQAVNTMRDLTHIDQTMPFISSVLEQPISVLTNNEYVETATIANGEECFELPPIQHLPSDISENVLESIINEFKDVSTESEELRKLKSEELERKLKLYNSIMEREWSGELIHSSRRRARAGSAAPSRDSSRGRLYTTPCLMDVSVYNNIPQESDDVLEKQIEEKEKILAKMLNLESLSIKAPTQTEPIQTEQNEDSLDGIYKENHEEKPDSEPERPTLKNGGFEKPVLTIKKDSIAKELKSIDLVPKLVQLPNNWNLGNIELKLDLPNGVKDGHQILSPDEHIENEWEFV